MQKISVKTKVGQVEGTCDPGFSSVVDAFVTNFEARGEVGASCAIQVEGKTLVDIWGGRRATERVIDRLTRAARKTLSAIEAPIGARLLLDVLMVKLEKRTA